MRLWFDVERQYKTIYTTFIVVLSRLWFDVERQYKTMAEKDGFMSRSCGLM